MAVSGQLSRVSSSQSLMDAGMTGGAQVEGELTMQESGGGANNGRKRKAGVKGKGKEASLASSGTANTKVLFNFNSLKSVSALPLCFRLMRTLFLLRIKLVEK